MLLPKEIHCNRPPVFVICVDFHVSQNLLTTSGANESSNCPPVLRDTGPEYRMQGKITESRRERVLVYVPSGDTASNVPTRAYLPLSSTALVHDDRRFIEQHPKRGDSQLGRTLYGSRGGVLGKPD